jgi:quercetin dioxygenase-like cupin family protein
MKTIRISREAMKARIARFRELQPLALQQNDAAVPQAARDVVYARKLLSVIGLAEGAGTPINEAAPIRGAAGMTMTLAVCPPGQGPGLHAHRETFETFTVLKGRFEVRWNDDGSERVVLEAFDTISVPPGVCRAFRNVSDEEGLLQVLITGGVHDMNDIAFTPSARAAIEDVQPGLAGTFESAGFTFGAGT